MPSAQKCAERLREQAYRTLLPQIRDLEQELQSISTSLSTGLNQLGRRLEALGHIELPTTEQVLDEILGDVTREKDLQTSSLVLFARHLRHRETQEEILGMLLDAAQKYSSRAALFAVRGNRFVGWSSRGFSEALSRNIGSSSFLRSDCPKFEEVLEEGNPAAGFDPAEGEPLHLLKEEVQGQCLLIPLRVLQRPVALLLADGAGPAQNGSDPLFILAELAVLRLENIALKILYELTSATAEAGPDGSADRSAPVLAAEVEPEPAAPVRDATAPVAQAQEAPASAPASILETDEVHISAPPAEAVSIESGDVEKASPAAASAQAEAPPPLPKPESIKIQPPPEEEKLHSDAKRFARLLVSEIKLYNEHHVVEGRENRDLYLRLKRDIDRSREMYEKRVSPNVSRRIDYFHDEIIRILGDNDPFTLGSDYPGPRVES